MQFTSGAAGTETGALIVASVQRAHLGKRIHDGTEDGYVHGDPVQHSGSGRSISLIEKQLPSTVIVAANATDADLGDDRLGSIDHDEREQHVL